MEDKKNMNIILAVVVVVALVAVLVFISIRNKTNMATENNGVKNTVNDQVNIVDDVNKNTNNNTAQAGEVAKKGDIVAMNYTGRLENGTVFDSNVDPKFQHVQPFVFNLGAGEVIAGWDKGIVGMKVGEKKTLTIPPADGYGAAGAGGGAIPPNATLIFEVELLEIKK